MKSLSIKQGLKYDAPESARDIPAFIEFHNLNMDEIRDPLNSFSAYQKLAAPVSTLILYRLTETFNEFFYR